MTDRLLPIALCAIKAIAADHFDHVQIPVTKSTLINCIVFQILVRVTTPSSVRLPSSKSICDVHSERAKGSARSGRPHLSGQLNVEPRKMW